MTETAFLLMGVNLLIATTQFVRFLKDRCDFVLVFDAIANLNPVSLIAFMWVCSKFDLSVWNIDCAMGSLLVLQAGSFFLNAALLAGELTPKRSLSAAISFGGLAMFGITCVLILGMVFGA